MSEQRERNQQMAALEGEGKSRANIAREFGLSRQRVLQILGVRYKPGKSGITAIPQEDIEQVKRDLAFKKTTTKDVAQKYHVTITYVRQLVAGYKSILRQEGMFYCSHCKCILPESKRSGHKSLCNGCNSDRTIQHYWKTHEPSGERAACKKCGKPVSTHHLAQFNHGRWHQRVDGG